MADSKEKQTKYDVFRLSDYIIKYYKDNGKTITNVRLQEILYFIQAYFLMRKDDQCFIDDIEARDVGPVVGVVYDKYSEYGANPIPLSKDYEELVLTDKDYFLVKEVLEFTFEWSNGMMTNLVHDQRPYRHARDNTKSKVIMPEKIKDYFVNA